MPEIRTLRPVNRLCRGVVHRLACRLAHGRLIERHCSERACHAHAVAAGENTRLDVRGPRRHPRDHHGRRLRRLQTGACRDHAGPADRLQGTTAAVHQRPEPPAPRFGHQDRAQRRHRRPHWLRMLGHDHARAHLAGPRQCHRRQYPAGHGRAAVRVLAVARAARTASGPVRGRADQRHARRRRPRVRARDGGATDRRLHQRRRHAELLRLRDR